MQLLIETLIYILACLGIILVTASFFVIVKSHNNWVDTYTLFNDKNKKVQLTVKMYNLSEKEKQKIISKINNINFKEIEKIADNIEVDTSNIKS